MSEGVVRREHALIKMINFPMPEKTHKGSCRAAAAFFGLGVQVALELRGRQVTECVM